MTRDENKQTRKNRRLAILLGLVVISIYVGYVLVYYFDL
jgi:uncharacterized membrane protein (DUF485 family)